MTETPTAATGPATGPAKPAETPAAATDTESNREAARYRRQLRDTETARDALQGQLDAMRRAEVERIAAGHLAKPAGLWASGAELAGLLADDGTVDPEAVAEAAASAADALGLESPDARLLRGNTVPREGGNPAPGRADNWTEAFTLK